MTQEFDPKKEMNEETLREVENYLKTPPISEKKKDWIKKECEHFRTELDAENKTVTCRDCKKVLDAFWYLQLLAKEWSLRRYQDAEAIKAYRELEQQRKNAIARGQYRVRPDKGEGMICWDSYEALNGHPPEYVYYRGGWYAGHSFGEESFELIKMVLARKCDTYRTDKEEFLAQIIKTHGIYKYLAEMIYNEGFKNGREYKKDTK